MIHKDYFIEGRILINIFEDKVEIGNPGKLLFNQKELGKVSILRNPILADCILRTGLVEKIGSGIKRIKELVPNVNFEISSNWFRVVFERKVNAGVNAGINLSDLQIKLIDLLQKDKYLSAKYISNLLQKDIRTIERNLSKLVYKNIIKRVGSNKDGFWIILLK